MKILFSAIGTSDPVRGCHDGAWLHCLRKELPELTYIYLSRDMNEYEEKYRFYSRALELFNQDLAEKGQTPIKREIIPRPDLSDPHRYGNLYADIKKELIRIHEEHPDAELLINCSSGTPAIKNTLTDMPLLLPFGKEIRLLQVDGPDDGKSYKEKRVDDAYDLDGNWECNLDREGEVKWRVHPLEADQHDFMVRAEYARILVRRHDYSAALLLVESNDMSKFLDMDRVRKALDGADKRKMLQLHVAGVQLNQVGIPSSELNKESTKVLRQCAEMLLTMQNDVEAHDYANMLRKITPLMYKLAIEYVKITMKCDLEKYYASITKSV